MLKPIHPAPCAPALLSCQILMQHLVNWLCSANSSADITQANCAPPKIPSKIEADWLWGYLQLTDKGRSLLERAQSIADLTFHDKQRLFRWSRSVATLERQFQPAHPLWPTHPPLSGIAWKNFQELMQGFYKKAFKTGLPYMPDGTPTVIGGVTYQQFVEQFRVANRLNPHPNAREVCVFCGGPLIPLEVDHWVAEGAFPLLAICAGNLVAICESCNSTTNKGQKPVSTAGSYDDWFHPFLRHANGAILLNYNLKRFSIVVNAVATEDQPKVDNLNRLLKLESRWSREFKAEYQKQSDKLKRRRARGKGPNSETELNELLQEFSDDLSASEPHYEVHGVLAQAMLDPARISSWLSELEI